MEEEVAGMPAVSNSNNAPEKNYRKLFVIVLFADLILIILMFFAIKMAVENSHVNFSSLLKRSRVSDQIQESSSTQNSQLSNQLRDCLLKTEFTYDCNILFIEKSSAEACQSLESVLVNNCLYYSATLTGNKNTCSEISSEELKANCIDQINPSRENQLQGV